MPHQIHTICCTECGDSIGYHWAELKQPEKVLCYACMEDIGIISDALSQPDLRTHDLYRAANGPRSYKWQIERSKLLAFRNKLWDYYVAKKTNILHANKNKT